MCHCRTSTTGGFPWYLTHDMWMNRLMWGHCMKLSLLTQGSLSYKLCPSSMTTFWLQIWLKTPTLHHPPWIKIITPFISVKRLWGTQELPQGVGLIFLETRLSHNSISSEMHQLQQHPLKMKMCSRGTRRASFIYQFFPFLVVIIFQYRPAKLKMRGTSPL